MDLTAEVIEIGEEDPIIALYSPKLLKDVYRIIGNEPVRINGDATFKTVPKHLFIKKGKGKQLFNCMLKYNNRVNMCKQYLFKSFISNLYKNIYLFKTFMSFKYELIIFFILFISEHSDYVVFDG